MKWPTMDEFAQMVADKAIDEIEYNGKTLREWIEIISATELGTNLAEDGTDCITRQAAIDIIEDFPHGDVWNVESMEEMVDRIKQLPPAQPEIIRCKDCAWWTKQEDSLQGRCALLQIYPTGEWFCGNAGREVTT